jgi:catechol 2,3-dioxygenase-like lactoylglutathione lyase family enzyme
MSSNIEITLNHTIVPSFDNVESARFYENLFGFKFVKEWGHFAVVKVSPTLTLDFQTKEKFSSIHYAFKVSDEQFDLIFSRIKNSDIKYGSEPYSLDNGQINNKYGGRGVYFKDPNGHVLEIITADYIID